MTEISNLAFAYRRKESLFTSLSLTLGAGSIYGLLGKNGAGKTTLLKIMCGLIFPRAGSCRLWGFRAEQRNPAALQELYFLPEEFDVPPLSPRRYRQLYGPLYPRFSEEGFEKSLAEFEVDPNRSLHRMSYGQKKKFLISFGLATDCRLLLLDEPTNGLDIPSKSQFRRLVASALTEERTFLISTHQVRDMQNLIDPIIILEEGEIIFAQEAYAVSEKMVVNLESEEPDPALILYSEQVPGGYAVIRARKAGEDSSHIDLELLFNAVLGSRGAVRSLFEKGVSQ